MPDTSFHFEWDSAKAAANFRKHGVRFEEAATVFEDEHAFIQEDELHADEEARQIIIGYSARNCMLMVSWLQRAFDLIRIISARLASSRERRIYEERSNFPN